MYLEFHTISLIKKTWQSTVQIYIFIESGGYFPSGFFTYQTHIWHPSITSGTGICFRPRSASSARSARSARGPGGAAAGEARERGRAVSAFKFAKDKVRKGGNLDLLWFVWHFLAFFPFQTIQLLGIPGSPIDGNPRIRFEDHHVSTDIS